MALFYNTKKVGGGDLGHLRAVSTSGKIFLSACLYVCLSIHPSLCPACLSACLPVRPSICLSAQPCLHVCLSIHLSFCPVLPACLSVHPSIHLSACLHVRLYVIKLPSTKLLLHICQHQLPCQTWTSTDKLSILLES